MRLIVSAVMAAGSILGQHVIEEKRVEIIRATPTAPADVLMWRGSVPGAPMGAQTFEFVAAEGFGPARVVKGAPYAADTTVEMVQSLADGNRIAHKNASSFARDSEGRTRREINVEVAGKPEDSHKVIMIDDPVAGFHYLLNTRTKTATKMPMPKDGEMRGPGPMGPPMPGGPMPGAQMRIMRSDGPPPVTEELGKQSMEGVEVNGKRVTMTVPAGTIGNERALVSKTETWYSEALKTPVLVKRSDPRMGDTTSRTTNIRQGEQPRYLFEVPADYKVEDVKPRGIQIHRKGAEEL